MHVVVAQFRNVVVDDVRDIADINPATNDIGGNQVIDGAVAKGLHHLVASRLSHIAVDCTKSRQLANFD